MYYAIIDIEATGGSPKRDKITEIAIFRYDGNTIVDSFSTLVNPEITISPYVSKLTGITDEMVAVAPKFGEVADRILEITKDAVFVAHNVQVDYAYLRAEFKQLGHQFQRPKLCTVNLTKVIMPELESYSLGSLCTSLKIPITDRHRAAGDARATVHLFEMLLEKDEKLVKSNLNPAVVCNSLPEHLPIQALEKMPEETGVYFLHDKKGKVIFVGKSADIRRRVMQNFTGVSSQSRKWAMIQHTHNVTCEPTGSELIAQILEFYYIQKLRPLYNSQPRRRNFKYGVFKTYDKKGYICLAIKPLERGRKPISYYEKKEDAQKALQRQLKQHQLCGRFCQLNKAPNTDENIEKACRLYISNKCKGACTGKEKASSYNYRVHQALRKFKYQESNFLIVGEGRTTSEKSVVCVENEQFMGYTYIDDADLIPKNNIPLIKDQLKDFDIDINFDKVIRNHLNRNKLDDIVVF